MPPPAYTVRIVERDGTPVRDLEKAEYLGRTRGVNQVGEIQWRYPKYDPPGFEGQGADVTPLVREVQILRDGQIWDWGVLLDPAASSGDGALMMTSPRTGWYFTRRYVDRPITNYLDNGGFETGDLSSWTAAGTGITATVISSPRRRGGYAVRLVQPNPGVDSHLDQTVSIATTAVGDLMTLAADVMIESWGGAAIDGRGLYVEVRDLSSNLLDVQTVEYDPTIIGDFQTVKLQARLDASVTRNLEVRLNVPAGSIVVDEIRLVKPESLSSALPPGTDIATLFAWLVLFAQGNLPGLTCPKDDLYIDVDDTATTGVELVTSWPFANHTPVDRAIQELVEMEDGIDWSMEVIAGVKTAVAHWPRKGTDRSVGVSLTYGGGGNCSSYTRTPGAALVETDVTIMGDGSGPEREEAHAVDTSNVDLVLQGVYPAPAGASVEQLDPISVDHLNRTKKIVPTLEMTTIERAYDLEDLLEEGDRVIVFIDDGNIQISGEPYRIITINHTARNRTLKVSLIPDPS